MWVEAASATEDRRDPGYHKERGNKLGHLQESQRRTVERELKYRGLIMWVEAASATDDRRDAGRREHAAQLFTRRIWKMMMTQATWLKKTG